MKRVVVTGSSGGIGQATAAAFVEAGWRVVGIDRAAAPETIRSEIEAHTCDLADFDSLTATLSGIAQAGEVDALVNNAAIQLNSLLVDTSDAEWDLVMRTNAGAAFVTTRELVGALERRRGAVVNVASVHAVATSGSVTAYASSKGALVAFTRAAAVELADRGVRCNAVLPGAVDTAMLREGLGRRPHPDGDEGNLAELIDRTPLRTVADPRQIAETIVFLADPARSSYITGQSIVVDGGATARLSTE